jgi:hypothetical protein
MKPTAWLKELPPEDGNGMMMTIIEEVAKEWEEPVIPLYPKDAWVGLTDAERNALLHLTVTHSAIDYAKAIEAKLKEKNG